MLQRIQTVYMLGSVIAIVMMLFNSLGAFSTDAAVFSLTGLGLTSVTADFPFDAMRYPLLLLLVLMFALPLVSIFLYNNRKVQMRILIYTAIVDVLFYPYFIFFESDACKSMAEAAVTATTEMPCVAEVSYQYFMLAMPVLSIFCCVMAIRGIAYDIALLASADRLRPSRK